MADLIIIKRGHHASCWISVPYLALKIVPVLEKPENLKCHGFNIFFIQFFIYPIFGIETVIITEIKYIYSQGQKKSDNYKE
jgi:hypothetical protein